MSNRAERKQKFFDLLSSFGQDTITRVDLEKIAKKGVRGPGR